MHDSNPEMVTLEQDLVFTESRCGTPIEASGYSVLRRILGDSGQE